MVNPPKIYIYIWIRVCGKTYGFARRLGHVESGQGDRDGGGSEDGQGGEELHCDGLFWIVLRKRLTKIDLVVEERCQ